MGVQEIDVLGRMGRLHLWRITCKADAKHRNMIMGHFGLTEDSKSSTKTVTRLRLTRRLSVEQRSYSALAVRLNYIDHCNPCIQFSAKKICISMSCPPVKGFRGCRKERAFHGSTKRREPDAGVRGQRLGEVCCDETFDFGGPVKLSRHDLKTWCGTQSWRCRRRRPVFLP